MKSLTTELVDSDRLQRRIEQLAQIGKIEEGGVCRLALTAEDKAGRDHLIGEMRELGLNVTIDQIGNIFGRRKGTADLLPIMVGSHIDTVKTGGRYDGSLGVLAGLELVAVLNDRAISTARPIIVAAFTNEEGSRFQPDMMGSLVFTGQLSLDDALSTAGIDGTTVGDNLHQIGYQGETPCGTADLHAYVELHIEQGPVLDEAGAAIGVVQGVQGISWTEFTLSGVSNHAGTTPMRLRKDAGFVAMEIACFARKLAKEMGGHQVATVGRLELSPNLVNVVPDRAIMTVDLRNTNENALKTVEERLFRLADEAATREGVLLSKRTLARFEPVTFDPRVVALVEKHAHALGLSTRSIPSGAGHDAQILAARCPAGMIFVPSVDGLSHNVREFTKPDDIAAGANVLLNVVIELASDDAIPTRSGKPK